MALPVIPNIALGRYEEYCQLAKDKPTGFANAGLVWILLANAGLEADTVLRDYASVSTLLAAANDEATFTLASGTLRKAVVAADITLTVDNSGDTAKVDITTDPTWLPTSAQAIGAIILAFDPDTTGGTDADLIPLFIDSMGPTTTGTGGAATPFTYQVASGGFDSAVQA